MKTPTSLIPLINKSLFKVQPRVMKELRQWRRLALAIPDPEIRRQALLSIDTKAFHCQGGAILGLLAGDDYSAAIRFIVAYQTISDYLDNLCDRSTSLDPADFAALHESMAAALLLQEPRFDYYRFRREREDGGYLAALIAACRQILGRLPRYELIAAAVEELSLSYRRLQVYKHVINEERVPLLEKFFAEYQDRLPPMQWYEFSACTGSTLGIFALVANAFNPTLTSDLVDKLKRAYFPWVQGLHILLDYLIDQDEDRQGGDLNFCFFYQNPEEMETRLVHFYRQAQAAIASLPEAQFHLYVVRGLLGTYLADRKVSRQDEVRRLAGRLLPLTGWQGVVLYLHCYAYRRLKVGQASWPGQ